MGKSPRRRPRKIKLVDDAAIVSLIPALVLPLVIEWLHPHFAPQEEIFLISLIFASSVAFIVLYLFLQLREIKNITADLDVLDEELSISESRSAEAVSFMETEQATNLKIANAFTELESSRARLESLALDIILHKMKPNGQSIEKLKQDLLSRQNETLKAICDTAVTVLSAKKRRITVWCESNIKALRANDIDCANPIYKVISRSGTCDSARDADEEDGTRHLLKSNSYYTEILSTNTNAPDYYVLDDIDLLRKEMLADRRSHLTEPSEKAVRYYKSAIVFPIRGPVGSWPDILTSKPELIRYKSDFVAGFICVDSKEVGFFDDGYDRHAMGQLAAIAYGVIRIAHIAIEFADERHENLNKERSNV